MSIECKYLSKYFKDKCLFKDINVEFEKGICNSIVGDNGSGKTTLLRILAGLEKKFDGKIKRHGTCTYLGSTPYMIRGTVYTNLEYPLTLKQQYKKDRSDLIEEFIEKLGLKGLENREAITLSSGEKQKVALGRSLIVEPNILLLDEPTANIDKDSIETIENVLINYTKNKDRTLLLVSHNFEQVKRLSDQIYILKDEKLIKETVF